MALLYGICFRLALTAVVQIAAIVLIYRHRNKKRNKHQINIISSLCLIKLNGTLVTAIMVIIYRKVSPLISHATWFYVHFFVRLTYHSTMTVLTIDRFLEFHLNMRYLTLWPHERLLKSLKVIFLISFLTYFTTVCLFFIKPIDWDYVSNVMFTGYFIWDVIYVIQVVATYIYIFIKYKKHKKLVKRLKVQSNTRQHFKLLIPTLVVVTFIIFFCIPDFLTVIFQSGNVIHNGLVFQLLSKAYKISWLADPVIFICSYKLLRKVKNYPNSQNCTTSSNIASHF